MRTSITSTKHFALAVITLIVSACSNNNIVTTTLGPDITVILNDSVYFQNNSVGKITGITRSDLGTNLQISIDDDALPLISSDAVVIENSFKPSTPIEIHNGIALPGSLEIGGEIKGINNMVQFGTWSLGNAIGIGSFSLNKYINQFTEYVNSDDFSDQQADVNKAIQQSTALAKQAVTKLGDEVDSGLQQLQEMEDDLALAGEQIGSELETTAKELGKSSEEIFQEFEKLIEKLTEQSQVNSKNAAHGANILLALLQGLNGSLEENQTSNTATSDPTNPDSDPTSGDSKLPDEPLTD